jgi:hypothetical protein
MSIDRLSLSKSLKLLMQDYILKAWGGGAIDELIFGKDFYL